MPIPCFLYMNSSPLISRSCLCTISFYRRRPNLLSLGSMNIARYVGHDLLRRKWSSISGSLVWIALEWREDREGERERERWEERRKTSMFYRLNVDVLKVNIEPIARDVQSDESFERPDIYISKSDVYTENFRVTWCNRISRIGDGRLFAICTSRWVTRREGAWENVAYPEYVRSTALSLTHGY